jgi:hypothetical protein
MMMRAIPPDRRYQGQAIMLCLLEHGNDMQAKGMELIVIEQRVRIKIPEFGFMRARRMRRR